MAGFNLGDIFVTFKAKTEDLQAGVQKVQSGIQSVEKTVNRTSFKQFATQASTAFGGIANAIQNVVTKAILLAGAGTFGIGKFVSLAGELQTTQQRMAALAGSTDQAKQIMGELYQYVLGKPIAFPEASKAAQTLMGYGVAAKDVVAQMKTLSAFSIVNGADMSQLALAMGQVNAKGRLMGQEIIQLTNNFVPVSQVIAKHFNVSIQEAQALMEDGKVTAAEFNQAMAEFIPQGAIDAQSNTFKNRLISLQGSIRSFGLALLGVKVDPKLGLVVEPGGLFDRLSNFLPRLAKGLTDLKPKVVGAFNWLVNHGDLIKAILVGVAAAFIAAKVAAIGFAIAAAANPVTLIAAAVVVLIGVLAALQMKFDWIGKTLQFLQPFWEALVQIFDQYLKPSLQALADTFMTQLLPALMQIWDALVKLWDAINPGFTTALKVLGAIIGALWIAQMYIAINVMKIVIQVISWIASGIAILIGWIANLIGWYGNMYGAAINAVRGILGWFGKIPGAVAGIVDSVVGWFRDLPGRIGGAISGIVGVLTGPFKAAFNAIADFWNRTVAKVSFKAPDWVPGIGGKGWSIPQMPHLAVGTPNWRGGMATMNEFGPETAVLPKGTRVVTADQTRRAEQGGAGNSYYISLNGVMARSESELADIMEKGIKALDRRLQGAGKQQIMGSGS